MDDLSMVSSSQQFMHIESVYLPKRIENLFQESEHVKVGIIWGEMGVGKTVALASYLHKNSIPAKWITKEELPILQAEIEQMSPWARVPHHKLPKQVYVMDDFHEIMDLEWAQETLPHLVKKLPSHVQLWILSRKRPKWPGLSVLLVKGQLIEINSNDLIWKEKEIEEFIRKHFPVDYNHRFVQIAIQETLGWPVAICHLIKKWLRYGLTEEVLPIWQEEMFLYMEEEYWNDLSEEMKRKEESSIFQQEVQLSSSQFQKESIIFQPFLKKMIQWRLQKDQQRRDELLQELIPLWINEDHFSKMMDWILGVASPERIQWIIETWGAEWLQQGKIDLTQKLLDALFSRQIFISAPVFCIQGDTYRLRCKYESAKESYILAEQRAIENHDILARSKALEGLASIYLDTIQPRQAEEYLSRAIMLIENHPELTHDLQLDIQIERLQVLFVENFINSGKIEVVDQWIKDQRGMKPVEIELESRLLLRSGRLQQAKKLLESKYRKNTVETTVSRSHREIHLLLSLLETFMGNGEEAKRLAEKGILQGVKAHAPFVEACGWIRMGHAVQVLSRYDRNVIAECYQTALTMMDELGISRGKAESLMGLAILYGREGCLDQAKNYAKQALIETESVKDYWLSSMIHLGLAVSAYYAGEMDESQRELQLCIQRFEQCGDTYFLTITLLWKAFLEYEQGAEESLEYSLLRVFELMKHHEYKFLFQKRTLLGPRDVNNWTQLLFIAQARELDESYVAFLLQELGLSDRAIHPGYTLRVQTLGEFRVWRGDEELPTKIWQREKAKELFQLLITRRQTLLSKEEICQLLWPEGDEKVSTRDFKVALHAMNQALEPKRSARANSFYIVRQGSLYSFDVSTGYELDAEEFEKEIVKGLKENDPYALKRGLELYKGSYLPERVYEDWCYTERERLQTLFLHGAERLAQLLEEQGKLDEVLYWTDRMLQVDPCWEEAYRLQMTAYYLRNNRPQSMKRYQKCVDVLERELGVTPMPLTQKLYQQMVQGTFCNSSVTSSPYNEKQK